MLTCHNITLENPSSTVFFKLNFSALPGSISIIKGPNGSGKTSLLKIIVGLIRDYSGDILWNNTNTKISIETFQQNVCYIGQANALIPDFSVKENLKFYASLKGNIGLLDSALHYFDLNKVATNRINNLSAGWQRKVELSKLILSDASLWLLDEPDNSLDEDSLANLDGLLKAKTRDGRGVVIVTSHRQIGDKVSYINMLDFKK